MPGYRGKRALDLVLVVGTLPVWLPLFALTALLVRASIGSPVFFRQGRPGRHGRRFELIKFRTMTDARGADGQLLPDAERLTRVGRLLRSTSLDELPELLNVLRGEMSVVGPRPLLEQYLPLYSSRQRRRHEVRPGLTGLAQATGRNRLSWPERLELDVRYVEGCNLALDVSILLRTIRIVLTRHGVSAPGEATMSLFRGDAATSVRVPSSRAAERDEAK
jgi:sugar transferase EpsL